MTTATNKIRRTGFFERVPRLLTRGMVNKVRRTYHSTISTNTIDMDRVVPNSTTIARNPSRPLRTLIMIKCIVEREPIATSCHASLNGLSRGGRFQL